MYSALPRYPISELLARTVGQVPFNLRLLPFDKHAKRCPLGDVTLPDAKYLNWELVKAGYAWWYRRYAPNDHALDKLENEARNAKRGLWVDPNPIPPWKWRKSNRQ